MDYLYIMRNGETNQYKIGIASCVSSRLKTLQTGCPFELKVATTWEHFDRKRIQYYETFLHRYFNKRNQRIRGEWYTLTDEDLEILSSPQNIEEQEQTINWLKTGLRKKTIYNEDNLITKIKSAKIANQESWENGAEDRKIEAEKEKAHKVRVKQTVEQLIQDLMEMINEEIKKGNNELWTAGLENEEYNLCLLEALEIVLPMFEKQGYTVNFKKYSDNWQYVSGRVGQLEIKW